MSVSVKWNHSSEYWQEYFEESATINRSSKIRNFVGYIFIGIILGIVINIVTPFYYKDKINYFINGFLAAFLLMMAVRYVNTYFSRKNFVNSYQDALPGAAVFSDESFTVKTQNSDSTFRWGAVTDLISSKRGLIVCLRGGGVIYVPEARIEDNNGKKKILDMYEKAKNNSVNESTAT
jgi:purine-cytosine permease-like protein